MTSAQHLAVQTDLGKDEEVCSKDGVFAQLGFATGFGRLSDLCHNATSRKTQNRASTGTIHGLVEDLVTQSLPSHSERQNWIGNHGKLADCLA